MSMAPYAFSIIHRHMQPNCDTEGARGDRKAPGRLRRGDIPRYAFSIIRRHMQPNCDTEGSRGDRKAPGSAKICDCQIKERVCVVVMQTRFYVAVCRWSIHLIRHPASRATPSPQGEGSPSVIRSSGCHLQPPGLPAREGGFCCLLKTAGQR